MPIDVKVEGRIVIKSFLSGMPECRLGLNNQGEDAVFPQFVNTSKWLEERQVTFVPPDGEFVVMNYRCSDNIDMPFMVKTNIVEHRTSLKVQHQRRLVPKLNKTLLGCFNLMNTTS